MLMIFFAVTLQQAVADPSDDADAAYEKGDYATAIDTWQRLAEQNDAAAQVNLAKMYKEGLGVPQNYITAFNLYQRAAAAGNAKGQYGLGVMYLNGNGTPKSATRAAEFFS